MSDLGVCANHEHEAPLAAGILHPRTTSCVKWEEYGPVGDERRGGRMIDGVPFLLGFACGAFSIVALIFVGILLTGG